MRPDELDPGRLFLPIDPPPGGLQALRARLAHERQGPRPRSRLLLATAAMAALVLVGLGWRQWRERPPTRLMDQAMGEQYASLAGLGLLPLPSEPVTVLSPEGGTAVRLRRVPVGSPEIVFYLARSDQR